MSSYSFSDEAVKDINNICEYVARQNYQGEHVSFLMQLEKNVIWLLGFQIWAKVIGDLRQTYEALLLRIILFFTIPEKMELILSG